MDHIKLLCDIGEMSGIFSKSVSIETMLQKIVDLVAEHLSADVCSIYLFDETSQELILKATKGLHPDSVNNIRLRLGEGIAGFALKEPQTICEKVGSDHPRYKFFPGIFEERYEAFLAVPILRGISKIGVLIVQREKKICFTEQDVLAMRAVASQLGTIVENAKLLMQLDSKVGKAMDVEDWEDFRFVKGKPASEGFAFSEIILLDNERSFELLLEREFDKSYTLEDFNNALTQSENQLENLQQAVEEKLSDVASLIFAAHLMVLKDKGFVGKMRQLITAGENPPLAVKKIAEGYIHVFSQNPSPYIREKVQDIKDLVIRLMQNLVTDSKMTRHFEGRIVIAKELFPSDILKLSSEKIKGIVLVSGGVTSHLSILARSLQIPLIIANVPKLLALPEDVKVLMDAELGNIYINPADEIISRFQSRNEARLKLMEQNEFITPTTKTADGTEIELKANINLLTDLKLARELNADGVGLYRTEFPFLIRSTFPTEEEQFVVYRKLIEGMPGKEITLRTLDIGGDKVLSYFYNEKEQNPFLGMRSIRFSLSNKDIFRQQFSFMVFRGDNPWASHHSAVVSNRV